MSTIIACMIAGICMAGFFAIWFTTAYRELSEKRNSLADLKEQMHLHERLLSQTGDSPGAKSAARMLETSQMLCREAAKGYNKVLHKPMNCIPAMLMGFKMADETNQIKPEGD